MSNDRGIRFGLWYDFRNPAQWRQPADRLYREILDQIAWGENNGFDDVWLSEHHFIEDGYLPSILPAAAAIAARTNRIRIASGVLLMPLHNPIRLAEDIATVDVISGGRFELGVGIGFKREEFSGFGVSSKERGARTDQSLEIIRRSLAGETVTFKSEFFDFQNVKVTPDGVPRLSRNRRALRACGRRLHDRCDLRAGPLSVKRHAIGTPDRHAKGTPDGHRDR